MVPTSSFFSDGTLLLENLTATFPGTTNLKYIYAGSNAFRALKCAVGTYLHIPSFVLREI